MRPPQHSKTNGNHELECLIITGRSAGAHGAAVRDGPAAQVHQQETTAATATAAASASAQAELEAGGARETGKDPQSWSKRQAIGFVNSQGHKIAQPRVPI